MRRIAAALFIAVAFSGGATAEAWPERPVRFVVGFTPGGPSDILARALGQKLAESWGQQVVIENRPGAGGNIAAELVARSAPDGYTWLLGNSSILATNQSLYAKLGYDPVKDFAPVALVAIQPNILVVNPSVPASSVKELLALANAKTGALPVTTAKRSGTVPELPTLSEAGVPGFEAITWHGVVVPAATRGALVERLNADIVKVLHMRDLRERFESLGAELATGTPQDFAEYIAREIPKWAKVVKDSGARAD